MCYTGNVSTQIVGLRELRQRASELVRSAQDGETVTVTVNGRAAARLVPVGRSPWRKAADVAELFAGPQVDERSWREDLAALVGVPRDPWGGG
jgi:prevent-host-death family protein